MIQGVSFGFDALVNAYNFLGGNSAAEQCNLIDATLEVSEVIVATAQAKLCCARGDPDLRDARDLGLGITVQVNGNLFPVAD
jgi:hypothetical protein